MQKLCPLIILQLSCEEVERHLAEAKNKELEYLKAVLSYNK